jgi:nicotinamide riboside transporter PnuC
VTLNLIWSVALAIVGIVGIWLAGRRNLWGWAIGLAAQALWIVFALLTGQYGFIFSALAYGFVYGRNWLRWRRDRDEHSSTAG